MAEATRFEVEETRGSFTVRDSKSGRLVWVQTRWLVDREADLKEAERAAAYYNWNWKN